MLLINAQGREYCHKRRNYKCKYAKMIWKKKMNSEESAVYQVRCHNGLWVFYSCHLHIFYHGTHVKKLFARWSILEKYTGRFGLMPFPRKKVKSEYDIRFWNRYFMLSKSLWKLSRFIKWFSNDFEFIVLRQTFQSP